MHLNISLVIPCYNEVANLQKGVIEKIGNFTKNDSRFFEILIVDDGSTDKSRHIIKQQYLQQFPKFKLIANHHQGKAFTVIKGIREANGDYVMFSDMDLATPIEEAEKLIQPINDNYQIIIGSRSAQRKGAPLTRKILSLGMTFIRNYFIGFKGIKDTQCGFKLFQKTAAIDIIDNLKVFKRNTDITGSSVSAGFDLEFLFLSQKKGYKIKEVPVIWRHVETKNVNFLKDSVESMKDILLIKFYELTNQYQK